MSTTIYSYPDAYLCKFATADREQRALEQVALWGAFSDAWKERLCILQVYILACLENQADSDDLFSAKLRSYRDQLAADLPQALSAAAGASAAPVGLMSVPLERA